MRAKNSFLLFLHTKEQCVLAQKEKLFERAAYVVATTPEACLECQDRKITYRSIDSFLDREDLNSYREILLHRNMEWIQFLDQFLQEEVAPFAENDFKPADLYVNGCFGFLDEIFSSGYILTNIIKETKPTQIVHQPIPIVPAGTWSRLMPRVSLYQHFIDQFAAENNIPVLRLLDPIEDVEISKQNLSKIDQEQAKQTIFDKFLMSHSSNRSEFKVEPLRVVYRMLGKLFPPDVVCEYKLFQQYKQQYIRSTCRVRFRKRDKKKILMLGGSFDLAPLIIELRQNGCQIHRFDDPSLKFSYGSAEERAALRHLLTISWDKALIQPAFNRPFEFSGLRPFPIVLDILKRWWFTIIPELWFSYKNALNILSEENYSSVVTWAFGEGVTGAIVAAARKLKIPTFCYQHGGASRSIWAINTIQELFKVDYYLAYGDGTKKILSNVAESLCAYGRSASILSVGSARLEQLRKSKACSERKISKLRRKIMQDSSRPLILYVPTLYDAASLRVCDTALAGVDYFEFQQQLLLLFNKYNDYEYIYKAFPGTLDSTSINPIQKFITSHLESHIHYFVNMPVTEFMWAADLLIIDHNQTAVNELFLTNKKAIVFDQGSEHPWVTDPSALRSLEKRATVARNSKDFFNCVEKVLKGGIFSETSELNNEFLSAYGTHKNDALSARSCRQLNI